MKILNAIVLEFVLAGTSYFRVKLIPIENPPIQKNWGVYQRARFRQGQMRAQSDQRICLAAPADECTCSGISIAVTICIIYILSACITIPVYIHINYS